MLNCGKLLVKAAFDRPAIAPKPDFQVAGG